MTITIYVPRDSAALALGADRVATAITAVAAQRGLTVNVVRNGTRGLLWLEPLVEVATDRGRTAYGPVSPDDVPSLFDAGFLAGGKHALSLGLTEQIDYFKRQERLTFARIGLIDPLSVEDYQAHDGFKGLTAALALAPCFGRA
jgi:formate dehydrogenase iron-sulfur subunit